MGLGQRTDTPSRKDAHRGLTREELLFSRLFVSWKASLPTGQESRQVRRSHSRPDTTQIGRFAGDHHPTDQSDRSRMVYLLPTLPLEYLQNVRRNGSPPPAKNSSEATSSESKTPQPQSPLAECLLYDTWVQRPEWNPRSFRPIHRNLLTGEPYAGKSLVRFGGRGD